MVPDFNVLFLFVLFGPLALVVLALTRSKVDVGTLIRRLCLPCEWILKPFLTAFFIATHILIGLLGVFIFTQAITSPDFPVLLFWWVMYVSLEFHWNISVFGGDRERERDCGPRRADLGSVVCTAFLKLFVYMVLAYHIYQFNPYLVTWSAFILMWNIWIIAILLLLVCRAFAQSNRRCRD